MFPVNFFPATNPYWPANFLPDLLDAGEVVTIAVTVYGPNANGSVESL